MNKLSYINANGVKSNKERGALRLYYEKIFPYHLLYKWLSYGDPSYFLRREIAFVFKNVYSRHISFETESEFIQHILKKIPSKMEIGCIYDIPPQDYALASYCTAMEKELVFDIDMTDYDEIRSCCREANVCNKCWKFLCIACKILDRVIKEDFGFRHVLWVFSGRRGIHCWVCDKEARNLSNYERQSILDYINLIQGSANMNRRVKLPTSSLHNSIRKALNIIEENFIDFIIVEQDILGNDDRLKNFMRLLWDLPVRNFEEVMKEGKTSLERWQVFVSQLQGLMDKNVLPNKFKYLKEEIILHLAYPRLDVGVTKKLDHLLKSPFCVHPETGKICVPFLPHEIDNFDTDKVPTLNSLLDELNDYYKEIAKSNISDSTKSCNATKTENVERTSLIYSYNIFQDFVMNLES